MSIPTRVSRLLVLGSILVCGAHAGVAFAAERANAEELFQLGKGAMARGEVSKACGYFQASLDADFALGTLLNLAICHETAGKIASAWAEYRTLEDKARRATPPQADRAQFAREHAEALRPRLSRLRVVLAPEAARTKGLVVKIDGVVAAPELYDAGVPVDTGKRSITASAPERAEWSQTIAVDDERLTLAVNIPALAVQQTRGQAEVDSNEVERLSAERSRRTVGFVVGGIGVASLVTGGVFGLLAASAADDAKCAAPCFTTRAPEEGGGENPAFVDARDAYQRADTFGWVSNVTLAAGVIGIGVGTWLVISAGSTPAKPAAQRGLRLLPTPTVGGGALTIGGTL
jgi:hypothetical protein